MVDVSELESFAFCKKKWYTRAILGIEPKFDLMELGTYLHEWHDAPISKSEILLSNEDLGLKGKIDYYISEGSYTRIPVEIKKSIGSGGVYHSHEIQLTAYALLLMRNFGQPVPYGYLLYKEQKKKLKIPITARLMKETLSMLSHIKLLKQGFEVSSGNSPEIDDFLKAIGQQNRSPACSKCALEDFCWG